MEEFIVTLKNKNDLSQFYAEMENDVGTTSIPSRAVECTLRKPLSRNTVYKLGKIEAKNLEKDERILAITPMTKWNKRIIKPKGWSQASNYWDKTTNNTSSPYYSAPSGNEKNWGLLRCIEGDQTVSDWGYDSTTTRSATITNTLAGYNVDVIVVDGHLNSNHPEFLTNPNGTGKTRVKYIDWDIFTNIVNGSALELPLAGSYIYGDNIGSDYTEYGSDHGMHVAGIFAGNTQGWARGATIYNLSPYFTDNPNNVYYLLHLYDYIKCFHMYKPINPVTGKKNPTVINCSFGVYYPILRQNASIVFQGSTVTSDASSVTNGQLNAWGVNVYDTVIEDEIETDYLYADYYLNDPEQADIEDLIAEGVIFLTSAGNDNEIISKPGDIDYDNRIIDTDSDQWYYCRGDVKTPGGAISVGAVSSYAGEYKGLFSARGPGIDIYAPGDDIMSCVHAIGDTGTENKVTDTRDNTYFVQKYDGTSMSSPQVAGVIACVAEVNPSLTTDTARELIQQYSQKNQIPSIGSGYEDITNLVDLSNDANRYLKHVQYRPINGDVNTKFTNLRQTSGQIYPRKINKPRTHYSIDNWYIVHVAYGDSQIYKISGEDSTGFFVNESTSLGNSYNLTITRNDALTFVNFWGNGIISAAHPIIISTTIGGAQSNFVTDSSQDSYTFIPTSIGNYVFYCSSHQTMAGTITVTV